MTIYDEIRAERARAHAKHGDTSMEAQRSDDLLRLAILSEEVGEVAREFNDARHDRRPVDLVALHRELIQTAAMAAAWADACAVQIRIRGLGDCPDCGALHDPDKCGAGIAGCDCCASIEAEERQ